MCLNKVNHIRVTNSLVTTEETVKILVLVFGIDEKWKKKKKYLNLSHTNSWFYYYR